MKLCIPLISVKIEHFVDDDCNFQFGGEKFCLSLEDVYYLTGLPINGKPVIEQDKPYIQLCDQYLGRTDLLSVSKGMQVGQISCNKLRKFFFNVPENAGEEELDRHVRAYALYAIGCYICPGNSSDDVSTIYLNTMVNVNEIGSYAWGAALLSFLYRNIQIFRSNPAATRLRGNALVLELFAFEHFKTIKDVYNVTGEVPTQFPLQIQWCSNLSKKSFSTSKRYRKDDFRTAFDNLNYNEIIWRPYERLSRDVLPDTA